MPTLPGRRNELVPAERLLQFVHQVNARPGTPEAVSAAVKEICAFQQAHRELLLPMHVLSAVVGLGQGAMLPTRAESIEVLGEHVIRLACEANYPWGECSEALMELARSAPQPSSLVGRINVLLAFNRVFDELAEKSQGKFTSVEASACKARVQKLPHLALPQN